MPHSPALKLRPGALQAGAPPGLKMASHTCLYSVPCHHHPWLHDSYSPSLPPGCHMATGGLWSQEDPVRGSGWALGALSSCAGRVPTLCPAWARCCTDRQARSRSLNACSPGWRAQAWPAEGGLGEARGQDVPVVRVGRLELLCCQGDGGRFPSSLAFSFVVKCT